MTHLIQNQNHRLYQSDSNKFLSLFSLIVTAGALLGCEGDPGSPGRNQLPGDRYPPTVEIILPLATKPIYAQTVVEAIMVDDDTVAGYEFLIDGIESNSFFTIRRAPSLFNWDASALAPGRHTLQLVAFDAAGKVGESSLLYVLRSDLAIPGNEKLFYFTDSSGMDATIWKLPADSSGLFAGLGTRFTPDRPCLLKVVGVKLYRKPAWIGTRLFLDVFNERNGLPDSLLYRKVIALRKLDNEEFDDWAESSFRSGLPISGEFFAVVTLAEDAEGDTMAIQSDDGGWANGHGLMKTLEGEWKTFNIGRGRTPNPLIYAVVEY